MTTSISRRGFLGTTAGAAALSLSGVGPGAAQQFPERGLLVVVPYSAGGGSDISARLVARDLEGGGPRRVAPVEDRQQRPVCLLQKLPRFVAVTTDDGLVAHDQERGFEKRPTRRGQLRLK
jgi:tripartite-type tricarboxylate transporter receptor subunit TctC